MIKNKIQSKIAKKIIKIKVQPLQEIEKWILKK